MRYYELKELTQYFKKFKQIRSIGRIDDNVIRIEFDRKIFIGFDMSRGRSELFWADNMLPVREYNAPFDSLLKKRFNSAKILDVSLVNDDKILRFDTALQGAYRFTKTSLQFEFTGRYTNVIILDENGVVLEALRHIDGDASFRIVQPGVVLKPLKPYNGKRQSGKIEDVEEYLKQRAINRVQNRLQQLKTRYGKQLKKRIERLNSELMNLPSKSRLEKEVETYSTYGSIVLANLHKIKPYDKLLEAFDFEGNKIKIDLPSLPNPKRIGEYFYNLSRRAGNKLKNLHIEEENLKSRIKFNECMLSNLESAQSEAQIALLFPPKQQHKIKVQKDQCEVFWIDRYKILVGRNERENIWVLKNARANDLWLHLKDRPSSHCIIQSSDRKQIAKSVIEKAARICVETSVTQPGDYLVDITYRRNVKIERGAHVTYTNYNTIKVRKE
jgi:predicted ribosome quality control (RQC) complex YloA/Tae2 family protein